LIAPHCTGITGVAWFQIPFKPEIITFMSEQERTVVIAMKMMAKLPVYKDGANKVEKTVLKLFLRRI